MKNILLILAAILSMGFISSSRAQEINKYKPVKQASVKVPHTVPSYKQLAGIYYSQKDWKNYEKAMLELAKMLPYDGWIQYRLAGAYALQDNKASAFDLLLKMQDIGFAFDLDASADFTHLKNTGLYDHLQKGFASNKEAAGTAYISNTTKQENLLVDALAWDNKNKDLYMGTINTGEIWKIDSKGKETLWLSSGKIKEVQSIADLLIDETRQILWVVSNPSASLNAKSKNPNARSSVIAINLKNKKVVSHLNVRGDKFNGYLSAITSSTAGDIYIADAKAPFIYTKSPDKDELIIHANLKGLTGFRGLAVTPDNSRLYLADFEKGLISLDQRSGKVEPLKLYKPTILGGIEEIYFLDNNLFIVQPGMYPAKAMQFNLAEDGLTIIGLHTIGSSLEHMNDSTAGTPGKDGFFFIGNSQWGRFGKGGKKVNDKDEPTYIYHAATEPPPEKEVSAEIKKAG